MTPINSLDHNLTSGKVVRAWHQRRGRGGDKLCHVSIGTCCSRAKPRISSRVGRSSISVQHLGPMSHRSRSKSRLRCRCRCRCTSLWLQSCYDRLVLNQSPRRAHNGRGREGGRERERERKKKVEDERVETYVMITFWRHEKKSECDNRQRTKKKETHGEIDGLFRDSEVH